MAKDVNIIQMIKNKAHNSSYKAKSRAEENGVYVCTNKEKEEFEFIPLDQVIIKGVTLEQYIQNQKKEVQEEVNKLSTAVSTLSELVNALSKHMDNQRFL